MRNFSKIVAAALVITSASGAFACGVILPNGAMEKCFDWSPAERARADAKLRERQAIVEDRERILEAFQDRSTAIEWFQHQVNYGCLDSFFDVGYRREYDTYLKRLQETNVGGSFWNLLRKEVFLNLSRNGCLQGR